MFVLFIVALIDLIGFGMIFPLLPLFKLKYALTDMEVGYLVSVFALCGLFGSVFFGILSDKIGRKYVLAIPMLLIGVVYYFTGYAETYTELLLLRALAGFLTGNLPVCFAATSDLSTPENKFKYMGITGSAFSIGFISGPTLGGWLAGNTHKLEEVAFHMPFVVSGIVCVGAFLVAMIFFKETLTKEDRKIKGPKVNILTSSVEMFQNKTLVIFKYLTILFSLTLSALEVYMSLWLNERFGLTSQNMGVYWGAFSVIMLVAQMTVPRFISARTALIGGFVGFGISQFGLIFTHNMATLVVVTILMAVSFGSFLPSINANLALQGEKNQQGFIFGINQSFGSLGRAVGPYALGLAYMVNPNVMWLATGFLSVFTVVLIVTMLKKEPNKHLGIAKDTL